MVVVCYNGFFSNGDGVEMTMMMMIIFYDESVWREPLLAFCGCKNNIVSVLLGIFFLVSDRESRKDMILTMFLL